MLLKKKDDIKIVYGKIYIIIMNVLLLWILKYSIVLEVVLFFVWNDKVFYK